MRETVPIEKKLLLTIQEAVALSGIRRTTFYLLIQNGTIPTKPIGRRRMIPRTALEQFCKK